MPLKLPLSIKSVIRDWKSGELTLLALALVVSIACVSSTNILLTTIKHEVDLKASAMIGADIIVTSPIKINRQWQAKANALGMSQSVSASFYSMVSTPDNTALARIKAIKSNYPLRGELTGRVKPAYKQKEENFSVQPGDAWFDLRLFNNLKMVVGKSISVGQAQLSSKGIIMSDPGQGFDLFSIAPTLIISWDDIENTSVIKQGSQVEYKWYLTGDSKQLSMIKAYLKPLLTEQQKIIESTSYESSQAYTINQTINYLNLATLVSLILGCLAVSTASFYYAEQRVRQVALLRCFGMRLVHIIRQYIIGLVLIGLIASVVGIMIGYMLQPILIGVVKPFMPSIQTVYSIKPIVFSIAISLLILLIFGVTNILSLKNISVVNALKGKSLNQKTLFLTYALAFILFGLATYLYTKSWVLAIYAIVGFFSLVLFIYFLIFLLSLNVFNSNALGLNLKLNIRNIARNPINSTLQVVGISLALVMLISLSFARQSLLTAWSEKISSNTANYFLFNVEESQIADVKHFLLKNDIQSERFYPSVMGRIIAINDKSIKSIFGESANSMNALRRELNLSWAATLPYGNRIVAGKWQPEDTRDQWVSVEAGVAKRLGIHLNDKLEFRVADTLISAKVTSIRSVNWQDLKPNFYMLFKPGYINQLPKTYITSITLTKDQQQLINGLVDMHPNVSVIDISDIVNTAYDLLNYSVDIVNLMMLLGLITGIIIITLMIISMSSSKRKELLIMKTLGMTNKRLTRLQNGEAFIIGFVGGLVAIIVGLMFAYFLNTEVLHTKMVIPWVLLIVTPLASSLLAFMLNHVVMYVSRSQ